MWEALEAVHELRRHQTIISYIRSLIHTIASEEDNINDHLATLKNYWDRINQIADDNFKFSNSMFKIIISSSLSPAWDAFMEPYVGGQIGIDDNCYELTPLVLFRTADWDCRLITICVLRLIGLPYFSLEALRPGIVYCFAPCYCLAPCTVLPRAIASPCVLSCPVLLPRPVYCLAL